MHACDRRRGFTSPPPCRRQRHELGFETGPSTPGRCPMTMLTEPGSLAVADRGQLLRRGPRLARAPGDAGTSADDERRRLRASVRGRVAGPAVRARRRRRPDRLVAFQGARDGRCHRARPAARAGAGRRRQRRPAARRHVPRAGQRAQRVPDDTRLRRLDAALDAPEGAQRRDPGRSLDGPARRRRHRRREQRRLAARPRLLRSRLFPQGARRPRRRHALRRAAAEDRDRLVHGHLRARDLHAQRRLRRRRRRRARARIFQGAVALGAVRARHARLARPRRRQGVRDDARRVAQRRRRPAAGVRGDRPATRRSGERPRSSSARPATQARRG